ncbi:hypothetical protein ACFCYI_10435 [Streptomyces sp. NPDC056257]
MRIPARDKAAADATEDGARPARPARRAADRTATAPETAPPFPSLPPRGH